MVQCLDYSLALDFVFKKNRPSLRNGGMFLRSLRQKKTSTLGTKANQFQIDGNSSTVQQPSLPISKDLEKNIESD